MLTLGSGELLVRLPCTRTLPLSTRIAPHCLDCQHSCPISLHATSRKSFLTRDPGHLHPASFLDGIDRIRLNLTSAIAVIMEGGSSKRSTSRNRPSSRPTTPLRPSSRTSLRESQGYGGASRSTQFPLDALEPAFAELSDSMADLEANFMHLQLMHESLSRFSESFASFLYGLNMNAFCVDFPEVRLQPH